MGSCSCKVARAALRINASSCFNRWHYCRYLYIAISNSWHWSSLTWTSSILVHRGTSQIYRECHLFVQAVFYPRRNHTDRGIISVRWLLAHKLIDEINCDDEIVYIINQLLMSLNAWRDGHLATAGELKTLCALFTHRKTVWNHIGRVPFDFAPNYTHTQL